MADPVTNSAQEPEKTDDAIIKELAALSLLDYEHQRTEAASRLKCRPAILDKLVVKARDDLEVEATASDGLIADDQPFDGEVDGVELLREIASILRRHAILPTGADTAIALWIVGTYSYDAFRIWPKLLLSSPEKRCGKSTLLEIIRSLSHRALMASNITPSAIFRCIDAWKPTLLIDEADTFIHGNEELRGIINSGHTKSTAYVIRVVGDDFEPKQFSTWSPMVLAMIKLPPDTITDRSVTITMRRKLPGESVHTLPVDFPHECREIRSRCLKWASDHMIKLKAHRPVMPSCSNDRALDNWIPLFTLADVIGGKVPAAVLGSFQSIQPEHDDDDSIGPQILADLKYIFDGRGKKFIKLHSEDIVIGLVEMEERPWSEWKHGKPMTKNSLSNLLRPFKIKSKDVRIGDMVKKGYDRDQFNDAFSRYLPAPPFQSATPLHPSNGAAYSDFQSATRNEPVADSKTLKPTAGAGCSDVALQNPPPKPINGKRGAI